MRPIARILESVFFVENLTLAKGLLEKFPDSFLGIYLYLGKKIGARLFTAVIFLGVLIEKEPEHLLLGNGLIPWTTTQL